MIGLRQRSRRMRRRRGSQPRMASPRTKAAVADLLPRFRKWPTGRLRRYRWRLLDRVNAARSLDVAATDRKRRKAERELVAVGHALFERPKPGGWRSRRSD